MKEITEKIKHIPIADKYWEGISKASIIQGIKTVENIARTYIKTILYSKSILWPNERGLSPVNYLVQIKISALMDILANKWIKTIGSLEKKVDFPATMDYPQDEFFMGTIAQHF